MGTVFPPRSGMILTTVSVASAKSRKLAFIARKSLFDVAVSLLPVPIANHWTPSKDPMSAPLLNPNQSL